MKCESLCTLLINIFILTIAFNGGLNNVQAQAPGNALDFDGTDDYVKISNTPIIQTNAYAISAWVYIKDASQQRQEIFTSDDLPKFLYNNNGNKKLIFQTPNGIITSSNTLPAGEWVHVAASTDGANGQIYINGIQEKSGSAGGFNDDERNKSTGGFTRIGADDDGIPPHAGYFKGKIDEVRIWKTARTQSEIRNHMHKELDLNNATLPDLRAYYNFNSSSGTTLIDQTSNGNDGTLKNMNTSGSGNDWVLSGARIGIQANAKYSNVNASNVNTFGLTSTDGDGIEVDVTNGSADALKVIEVTGPPSNTSVDNSNLSGSKTISQLSQSRFWIVHAVNPINNFDYDFTYNYAGHPGFNSNNEGDLRLVKRADFAASDWDAQSASPNTANDNIKLTQSLDNAQFALATTNNNDPLPVELTSFEVRTGEDRSAQLTWSTASETNNSHFLVQRRNAESWQQIGRVKGHGTTTVPRDYTFTDANPATGTNYYRLKQVDYDGSFEYSTVEFAKVEASAHSGFSVKPVVNTGQTLKVEVKAPSPGVGQLSLFDVNGQRLSSTRIGFSGDETHHTLKAWPQIPAGIYFLKLKGPEKQVIQKVVKP